MFLYSVIRFAHSCVSVYFLFFIRFFLRRFRSLCLFIIFLRLLSVLIDHMLSSQRLPNPETNQWDANPKAERDVEGTKES